jgi:hypothetical protein
MPVAVAALGGLYLLRTEKQQRKLLLTRIFRHSASMPILQQKDTI